ncbi:ExeM/NucH family extracellular endonuclease [Moritella sp. 24]|uniref:ExeM/NucH family extracellular endonuclease n=1 Tax=Moritella sp. 24 TaxID=2746230 RepID=UPI001BAB7549|nr:ExeM/NucH family extracellular endonuclease [Moritella sp. 24]QUM76346.1 ExeM/NucH family extracellular endonuclease [Moritella sp. 24]
MLGRLLTCTITVILLFNRLYANELLSINNTNDDSMPCTSEPHLISQLQGEGHRSPYVVKKGSRSYRSEQSFTVKGVVTKWQRGRNAGFFMQQTTRSLLPLASTGIFVRTPMIENIKPNTRVCVTGVVEEHYGMTQLDPIETIIIQGSAKAIAPTDILVATADANFRETLERYEGMRVRLASITDMRVTKPLHYDRRWRRYNMILTHKHINIHPNSGSFPGSILADQHALENKQRRLYLQLSDKQSLIHELASIRVNDRVTDVVGILQFSYGEFRLLIKEPASKLQFEHLNDREVLLPRINHHLRIASFNLLNYFNSVAGGADNPLRRNRGATSLSRLHHQETKLAETIVALDADFIGLMEMENNGFGHDSAVQRLVRLVNSRIQYPAKHYKIVTPNQLDLYRSRYLGSGAITVAGLYRPSKLRLIKTRVINLPIQRSVLGNAYHRPALTPTFIRVGDDKNTPLLTISVNHFKSKGSKCVEDKQRTAKLKQLKATRSKDSQSLNKWHKARKRAKQDRQGNCAQFRVMAARVLAQALVKQAGHKIILGDLNSYPKEDPLLVLTDYKRSRYAYYEIQGSAHSYLGQQLLDPKVTKGFGYHDPFAHDNTDNWTYSFQALGRLDYILLSAGLLPHLAAKKVWHINASESRVTAGKTPHVNKVNQDKSVFSSSDHDPLFIELK